MALYQIFDIDYVTKIFILLYFLCDSIFLVVLKDWRWFKQKKSRLSFMFFDCYSVLKGFINAFLFFIQSGESIYYPPQFGFILWYL